MLKILRQPYPINDNLLKNLLSCLTEGLFVAIFLIIFKPFGISQWNNPNRNFYLLGFGLVTFLCSAFFRFAIRRIFKNYFQEKNWTIGREIFYVLCLISFIAIGNFFYNYIIFHNHFSVNGFFWMFAVTIIIGLFPTVFGVLINYIYQLKKYQQPIEVHHAQTPDNQLVVLKNIHLKLIAENEKDMLEIAENDLFFIESSDNYSTIFYLKNDKLQKELLRSSLSRLENQINSSNIVRCHRSYIVNLEKVAKVTGNAQGYKLHLETAEILIPVARKYSEIVEKLK